MARIKIVKFNNGTFGIRKGRLCYKYLRYYYSLKEYTWLSTFIKPFPSYHSYEEAERVLDGYYQSLCIKTDYGREI